MFPGPTLIIEICYEVDEWLGGWMEVRVARQLGPLPSPAKGATTSSVWMVIYLNSSPERDREEEKYLLDSYC